MKRLWPSRLFVLAWSATTCMSHVFGTTPQSGAITISPSSPTGSKSFSLAVNETANLTVTVEPEGVVGGVNYKLKGDKKVSFSQPHPDFLWSGEYTIVNAAGVSAAAVVTVKCVWEPEKNQGAGGGGAGGGRQGPPLINGQATGTAIAQPGNYWNQANGSPTFAVGTTVGVTAYKGSGELAMSDWPAVGGHIQLASGGSDHAVSVLVRGLAGCTAESEEYVTSIIDGGSLLDTETLTVVEIKSIVPSKEVVIVDDNSVTFVIETKPSGHQDLATHDTLDTGSAGEKTIVGYVGTSTKDCKVMVIKLESQTDATIPSNRTRTKLGVGETVKLTLQPSSLAAVSWSLTGKGTLTSRAGNPITYTAYERAVPAPSITATYKGVSQSVSFTIVEPSAVVIRQKDGTGIWHVYGRPFCGFKGWMYLTPADVSFENVEIFEGSATASCTGYFEYQEGLVHNQSPAWVSVGSVADGIGSKVDGTDTIQGDSDNHTPYIDGTFTWPIPWHFRVGSGEGKQFKIVNQVKTIDEFGTLSISKGDTTKSSELYDDDSSY